MKITGFVGKPEIARGNRTFENYYINGRYVKNNMITKAIENAYKGFLMQHKFPFVSLHIEMEGNDLDVNVHPRKMRSVLPESRRSMTPYMIRFVAR